MKLRGADILARTLAAAGARRVFALSGNHVMPVFDAALDAKLELLHVRHEAAAVHMADAWGRLTGEPGIALVTGGPGHANAVSALYTALAAESPLILISGHAPLDELGKGAFQEMRQADIAAPLAKASWTAQSAQGLAADVARAWREASSGRPGPVHLAIAEISMDERIISEHFGSSIFLFLLPVNNLKFAAVIPKGTYLTVCIIGNDLDANTLTDFLEYPVVKNAFPNAEFDIQCRCLPKMNVGAPRIPFTDRLVICGDAGSTRLMKDGIGAAYLMSKAAAKTAVFHGVSARQFRMNYLPVYRSLISDNWFGRYLFFIIGLYKKYPLLTKGMLCQRGRSIRVALARTDTRAKATWPKKSAFSRISRTMQMSGHGRFQYSQPRGSRYGRESCTTLERAPREKQVQ